MGGRGGRGRGERNECVVGASGADLEIGENGMENVARAKKAGRGGGDGEFGAEFDVGGDAGRCSEGDGNVSGGQNALIGFHVVEKIMGKKPVAEGSVSRGAGRKNEKNEVAIAAAGLGGQRRSKRGGAAGKGLIDQGLGEVLKGAVMDGVDVGEVTDTAVLEEFVEVRHTSRPWRGIAGPVR